MKPHERPFLESLDRINGCRVSVDGFIRMVTNDGSSNEPLPTFVDLGKELMKQFPEEPLVVESMLARAYALCNMITEGLPGAERDPGFCHVTIPHALIAAAATARLRQMPFGLGFDREELFAEALRVTETQGSA